MNQSLMGESEKEDASPLALELTECRKILAMANGENEAKSRQLDTVRGQLEQAYFTIAKQEELLRRLAQKLTSRQAVTESSLAQELIPIPSALSLNKQEVVFPAFSHLQEASLGSPNNIFYKLEAGKSLPGKLQEPVLRLVLGTEVRQRVERLWTRCPTWVDGAVRLEDACFLDLMIESHRPDHFYEIGVASGVSTAIILAALSRYAHSDPYWLHSYDLIEVCFFNNAYPVGGAVPEMVPELMQHWQMNMRTTALDISSVKKEAGKCMYFIDAMHSHPWPVMDLIALLPRLCPGDCVILHDINLPEFSKGEFPHYGAQWLFEHWPGPRIMPDQPLPNIGAIIMPEDWSAVPDALWQTLLHPWNPEIVVSHDHLIVCEKRLFQFLSQHHLGTVPMRGS